MNVFSSRIIDVIDSLEKGNSTALAKRIGIPPTTLHHYLKANPNATPKADILEKICSEYGVRADWMLLGNGPMMLENENYDISKVNESVGEYGSGKYHEVMIMIEETKENFTSSMDRIKRKLK